MAYSSSDILAGVVRLIESTLRIPLDQIDVDANLESFGVNSLIVMELMENIEKTFDVTLTPTQFSDINDIRGIAALLTRLLQKEAAPKTEAPRSVTPSAASVHPTHPAHAASMTPASASVDAAQGLRFKAVLDHLSQKYALDLSNREYESLDQIADTLLHHHADAIARHYGLDLSATQDGAARMSAVARDSRIAIVGMSCRLPDAPNPSAFWKNLISRRNSVRELPSTRWNWREVYAETVTPGHTVSKWGALIDDVDCFDAAFFGISAEEAAAMDPQLRLMIEEAYHALEDAGMAPPDLRGSRTGVFVGYEYSEYEQHLRSLNVRDPAQGPLFSSSSPSYYLANRISHVLDLCGPSQAFNVNCASSAVAIHRASHSLLQGESDVALAGAASLNLFAGDYVSASQYGVLSPDGSNGVFDDAANGFTRAEGVAMVVLKRLEDAQRDGDRIYGVVRASHEGFRGTARHISEVKHEPITAVLSRCYEHSGVTPDSIRYIEVDGYANKWADSFEYEGVKGAFTQSAAHGKHVALGSVKGNIGNVEPVSGVTSVIKLALAMQHQVFPATISMKKRNTFLDVDNSAHPLYIADQDIAFDSIRAQPEMPIRAGVNSFADSGTLVHIVLEEYRDAARPAPNLAKVASSSSPQLFVLSATDATRLQDYVQRYIDFLSSTEIEGDFSALIHTVQVARQALNERLAIVAASRAELLEKLLLVSKKGIKEKLGLEAKEIYHGRIDPLERSPLAALITAEMALMQLKQGQQSAQWKSVALLWIHGVSIPWTTLWAQEKTQRISLPTYPFARERHWLGPTASVAPAADVIPLVSVLTPAPQPEPISPSVTDATPLHAPRWHFHRNGDARLQAPEAPADVAAKLMLFLRQEVAAHLSVPLDQVETSKDFIALGLNSISIAEIIMKMDQHLGVSLSPSVLFKYPEIDSLSAYLAQEHGDVLETLVVNHMPLSADQMSSEATPPVVAPAQVAAAPADILIPLQSRGERAAIFAVPGAGSRALSMQLLSQSLGTQQPFYCLEPEGLDGRPCSALSVEEMAEFNLAALRTVQKHGPYRVLGYSNGGIVAFEMVRRLLEQGEAVSSLMLLDTLAPTLLRSEPIEKMMVEVYRRFIVSLGGSTEVDMQRLQAVPEDERSAYLYESASGLGVTLPRQSFIDTFNVAVRSERSSRSYQPLRLSRKIDVTLFRAIEGFQNMPIDYGWSPFVMGTLRTIDIHADHFTLLEKEAVQKVGQHISPPPTRPTTRPNKKSARERVRVAA